MAEIDYPKMREQLAAYFDTPYGIQLFRECQENWALAIAQGRAGKLIQWSVIGIEKALKDVAGVSGGAKKKALVDWLENLIKLPVWAEPFDGMLIGMLVDAIVGWLNDRFGHLFADLYDQPGELPNGTIIHS